MPWSRIGCLPLQLDQPQTNRDPTCKLCGSGPEDHVHFVCHCPDLSQFRNLSLLNPDLQSTLFNSDPHAFLHLILAFSPTFDHPLSIDTRRNSLNSLNFCSINGLLTPSRRLRRRRRRRRRDMYRAIPI